MDKFIKPWMNGYRYAVNFPQHYKSFLQDLLKQPSAVHYKVDPRKYMKDPETVEIKRIENVPIPLIYPKEADDGIWGGEGIVKGYLKRHKYHRRIAHWWIPVLMKTVLYSEILDNYMQVIVTGTTLRAIDKHYGFDNYILETPVQDLKSQLALDLRRMMLLALAHQDMYPDNPEKQKEIYDKYKKFIIPEDEAEWFGLSIKAAIEKQKRIEKKRPIPLKVQHRKELFEKLNALKAEGSLEMESTSWLSKLNVFDRNSSLQQATDHK